MGDRFRGFWRPYTFLIKTKAFDASKNIDSVLSQDWPQSYSSADLPYKEHRDRKNFPYMLYLLPALTGTILLIVFVRKEP